jgi:two-component system OmpR family response regulator
VILDMWLPDGDGLELARELTATGSGPKILVVSANIQEVRRHEAIAAGASGFVAKPYRPPELVAAIEQLLEPAG